jgi:uncharacterized membrane protein YhaH (DUF805 family)
MNFQQAIQSGFSNYANFRGRASRSEFWWFQLFILLGEVAAVLVDLFGNFTMLDGRWQRCSGWRRLFPISR